MRGSVKVRSSVIKISLKSDINHISRIIFIDELSTFTESEAADDANQEVYQKQNEDNNPYHDFLIFPPHCKYRQLLTI